MINEYGKYVPWAVVLLAAAYLAKAMLPPAADPKKFDYYQAGKLPIQAGGRIQPLDSFARNNLMAISNRQDFTDVDGKTPAPATKWVLDVMSNLLNKQGPALKQRVFRIENDQVLDFLKLPARAGSFRYSLEEIWPTSEGEDSPRAKEIVTQLNKSRKKDSKQRDLFDNKMLELGQHLQVYMDLAKGESPAIIPSSSSTKPNWSPLLEGAIERFRDKEKDNPPVESWVVILRAYTEGKPEVFNTQVKDYQDYLEKMMPETVAKADFEVFYNHFMPFYQCMTMYVIVCLLTVLGYVGIYSGLFEPLRRAGFWLMVLTFFVHVWALLGRMYMMDRWGVFVTNLYSSAVFIGLGCVLVGIVVEAIFRLGIGNLIGSVLGFAAVFISHHLARSGDTLEMMQAVLDTNFWLATHVTCVTYGYAATFVAGFLGIFFIMTGVFTSWLDRNLVKVLGQITYGIVCFATMLSFVGTVLGGIWADQSWGRFWGWDPKENGALLIVIWNALILHARWAGMVKQRGIAVLAVVGNIITAWSWFGVNMLGVGLHSYGFMAGAVYWLLGFVFSQLLVIGIGLTPVHTWKSFAKQAQELRQRDRSPKGKKDQPELASS